MLRYLLLLIIFMGCRNELPSDAEPCTENQLIKKATFLELTQGLPSDVVNGLVKAPSADGALGRNREGYFHVRFQMDMAWLAAYAVRFQNEEALEKFVLCAEYAFERQHPAGDFQLVIPKDLEYLGPPNEGDLVSGVSFFTSALGSGLALLHQSDWFRNRPANELNNRLNQLRSKFDLTVKYLISKKALLKEYDQDAPNRLFFDAVAFYSMGIYLNNSEAKALALEFVEQALAMQAPEGFLKEKGGFDSSYNGVALRLGLVLLGIIPPSDPLHGQLQQSMSCCAQWQASRVLPSGEISTEGNTRVYPGGEEFLGEEKSVAWVDSCLSFYFLSTFSQQTSFTQLAERIKSHYQ